MQRRVLHRPSDGWQPHGQRERSWAKCCQKLLSVLPRPPPKSDGVEASCTYVIHLMICARSPGRMVCAHTPQVVIATAIRWPRRRECQMQLHWSTSYPTAHSSTDQIRAADIYCPTPRHLPIKVSHASMVASPCETTRRTFSVISFLNFIIL
jgi:hypothetical protein